jgi:outer membrane receptor protein involved in Fe transport
MDVGLAKTFPLQNAGMWGKSVKLSIKVNNLFDKYYNAQAYTSEGAEYASPGAPRAVYGLIQVAF